MDWSDALTSIEALGDCPFDARLVATMQAAASAAPSRPLLAATPSFHAYATSELSGCCASAFPVFSVTGAACALSCDHCQAHILEPMIPALSPEVLEAKVRALAAARHLKGFLLSGGSNRRNEIAYERYYPTIERLKRDLPTLRIAIHSGLLDRPRAAAMANAGVDTAMMDVIGAEETVREVYHLDRPVADFEATLEALCETTMDVVPHIVIGLHYGHLRGESNALAICARLSIDALVVVVVMPVHARPGLFVTPATDRVGAFFSECRETLPHIPINLGCARPHGLYRRTIDAYAVMAGLDGIAFPAEGVISLARAIGRPLTQSQTCCAIKAATAEFSETSA